MSKLEIDYTLGMGGTIEIEHDGEDATYTIEEVNRDRTYIELSVSANNGFIIDDFIFTVEVPLNSTTSDIENEVKSEIEMKIEDDLRSIREEHEHQFD